MGQQAKNMLAIPESCANGENFWAAVWRISLLAKYFANSEFLRVCGVKFAIFDPKLIQIDPTTHHKHPATYRNNIKPIPWQF
jgi:hypothetical protein